MGVEDFKFLVFPALFLNFIFIKRIDNEKFLSYKNIQKNVMVLGFIYLLGISMISLSENSYINTIHIMRSLMVVLIFPIISIKLLEIKIINVSTIVNTIKLRFISIFNILYCILIVFLTLFYFFNKSHYINKYSFFWLFYLVFIYFLINFNKGIILKSKKN
ncbi:hypothetical protein Amet_1842 [Alkaliphilus metalliredigens QYMF]|uniref:Uncharacterized protein n=1 Tax=Alkaliphilus metalliredigens (strain QYMF) TaxID=293826 RepID=A6TP94_ALKMQ|nr:hypothetical protein Amet_1842 [Alkaliphilus metalliredigens QYMF]